MSCGLEWRAISCGGLDAHTLMLVTRHGVARAVSPGCDLAFAPSDGGRVNRASG